MIGSVERLLADPERGGSAGASPETIPFVFGFLVALFGAYNLCLDYLYGQSVTPVWLSWTLVAVPAVLLIWWLVGVSALDQIRTRRNQRVRDEMGPRLAEWLDLRAGETPTEFMAAQWRRAVATGLTQAEAQRWSDHGFSYTVAAAALRAKLSLPEVEVIAAEVRRGGGAAVDRRCMANVLTTSRWPGWYSWRSWSVLFNDPTVVLRGWERIPLHAIAPAVEQATASCRFSYDVGDQAWKELAGFHSY